MAQKEKRRPTPNRVLCEEGEYGILAQRARGGDKEAAALVSKAKAHKAVSILDTVRREGGKKGGLPTEFVKDWRASAGKLLAEAIEEGYVPEILLPER